VHLHFLAHRTWVYRFLIRTAKAAVIYNSRLTAEHYGANPERSHIIMPTLQWPVACPPTSTTSRVVAASALYPNKHLDIVVAACIRLVDEGSRVEALIFGRTSNCRGGTFERGVIEVSSNQSFIKLEDWDLSWTEKLRDHDVFVHLGHPESFGLVTLEAFARGLRLVVLPNTFLDDLPEEMSMKGVHRSSSLSQHDVADAIRRALNDRIHALSLLRLRSGVRHEFSKSAAAEKVSAIYQSLV
jgi:glycosyltransferase involved in cell wall biosynthesis